MQRVARAAFEVAAQHPMVMLYVSDHRFNGLAALKLFAFCFAHRLDTSPVGHGHAGVVGVHTPVAQVDEGLFHGAPCALRQRVALRDKGCQRVSIKRVAGEALSPDDQALFVGDGQAHFDAKLVAVSRLSLADAFHLGRMQRVELVFVFFLLRADAVSAFQKCGE